jgi:hypothetical protein
MRYFKPSIKQGMTINLVYALNQVLVVITASLQAHGDDIAGLGVVMW